MLSLNEQLTEVCHMLARAGYLFVVAGGFARDIAAGVLPKDADVCVYGHISKPLFMGDLPPYMYNWAEDNGLYASKQYSYGSGNSDFDLRCDGVIKLGDVDIIFYKDERSWQDVVNKFDFNLNQFYFPGSVPAYDTGTHNRYDPELLTYAPVFTPSAVRFGGNAYELYRCGLTAVRADYSEQREQYIAEKFVRLWPGIKQWLEDTYHYESPSSRL